MPMVAACPPAHPAHRMAHVSAAAIPSPPPHRETPAQATPQKMHNAQLPGGRPARPSGGGAGPTVAQAARLLMRSCPDAARLFLAGLAQDQGRHTPMTDHFPTLVRHAGVVERAQGVIASRGPVAHAALSHQLQERAPWTSTVEVFARYATARALRDFDRTVCRHDARATPTPHDTARSPAGGADGLPAALDACRHPSGLHARGPVQAAALMLYCAAAAGTARGQVAGPLLPLAGPTALPGVGVPGQARMIATAGSALALAGTSLWAGMRLWADSTATPSGAGISGKPAAVSATATAPSDTPALATLKYLSLQRDTEGENLLESLLWRLTGEGPASGGWRTQGDLTGTLAPAQAHALRAIAGNAEPSLDTWLTRLLSPHTAALALQEQPGSSHRLQRRAATDVGAQTAACRAIAPASQSLSSVDTAITQLTRADAVEQVADAHLLPFRACLVDLQDALQRRKDGLVRQHEGMRWGVSGDPAGYLRRLRMQGVMRLITRVTGMLEQVARALADVNQRARLRAG